MLFGADEVKLGASGVATGLNIASIALNSTIQQSNMAMQATSLNVSAALSQQKMALDATNENYKRLQNLQNYSWARERQLVQNATTGFKSNSATFLAGNQLTLSRAMANDRMASFNIEAQTNIVKANADIQRTQARIMRQNAKLSQVAGILGIVGAGVGFMGQFGQYALTPNNPNPNPQTAK